MTKTIQKYPKLSKLRFEFYFQNQSTNDRFSNIMSCHVLDRRILTKSGFVYLVKSKAFATCDGMIRGCDGGLAISGGCVCPRFSMF